MNDMLKILAKSPKNGGVPLIHHIKHTILAIEKIAMALEFDKELARKGAIFHDIGKVNPSFQKKISDEKEDIKDFITKIPHRHEISSILFLSLIPKEDWNVVLDMTIAHHKSISRDASERGLLDLILHEGKERVFETHLGNWDDWALKAMEILNKFGIHIRPISVEEAKQAFEYTIRYCQNKNYGWSRWRGLLNAADYFASAMGDSTSKHLAHLFIKPDLSFYQRDDRINDLYPLSKINAEDSRPHTIVSAPTGAGKTDFLLRRTKDRVFYMLPFQASINAMYERIKKDTNIPSSNISLLHAASRIVMRNSDQKAGFEERALQPLIGSSIKVLTPHQVAAIIFGTRGYESIMLDLMGCDIILDEIHSYSQVARSMVLEIIKLLKYLNCCIHVGSATMPSILKDEILKILGGHSQVYDVSLNEKQLESFNRHIISKIKSNSQVNDILNEAIEEGEKILFIRNTVKKAQESYEWIQSKYSDVHVMLIHSRYRRFDRRVLENKLMYQFNANEGPCIAVATQVIEVSLDISFDRMITECAPIDSMIQRFGRVNRKRNETTIGKYKPIHLLAVPENVNDALPYNLQEIIKSFDQLPTDGILRESSLQKKIDAVYNDVKTFSIDSHLGFSDGMFLQKELWHKPKSVIMDTLEIDSTSCVLESEKDKYLQSNFEDRSQYEIPIPWVMTSYKGFENLGRINSGTYPFIIKDKLYSEERGLII